MPDLFDAKAAILGDILGTPNYVRWFNQHTTFGIDDTAIRPNPNEVERVPPSITQSVVVTSSVRVIDVDSPFMYIVHAAESWECR